MKLILENNKSNRQNKNTLPIAFTMLWIFMSLEKQVKGQSVNVSRETFTDRE